VIGTSRLVIESAAAFEQAQLSMSPQAAWFSLQAASIAPRSDSAHSNEAHCAEWLLIDDWMTGFSDESPRLSHSLPGLGLYVTRPGRRPLIDSELWVSPLFFPQSRMPHTQRPGRFIAFVVAFIACLAKAIGVSASFALRGFKMTTASHRVFRPAPPRRCDCTSDCAQFHASFHLASWGLNSASVAESASSQAS
jgi:hypothetical protein